MIANIRINVKPHGNHKITLSIKRDPKQTFYVHSISLFIDMFDRIILI